MEATAPFGCELSRGDRCLLRVAFKVRTSKERTNSDLKTSKLNFALRSESTSNNEVMWPAHERRSRGLHLDQSLRKKVVTGASRRYLHSDFSWPLLCRMLDFASSSRFFIATALITHLRNKTIFAANLLVPTV